MLGWGFESGQTLHLNLSREWIEVDDDTEADNGWGIGTAYPLLEGLAITAEVFGSLYHAPDKALGLRYEVAEGLKLSGAVDRGSSRSFANLGVAWEF